MKKVLLSAAILIAACISAQAQFSLGIKGGVNFSKINTDNLSSSTRTGYQAGIFTPLWQRTLLTARAVFERNRRRFPFER